MCQLQKQSTNGMARLTATLSTDLKTKFMHQIIHRHAAVDVPYYKRSAGRYLCKSWYFISVWQPLTEEPFSLCTVVVKVIICTLNIHIFLYINCVKFTIILKPS